ncbi:MAG: peptide-binding protein [Desulfitibacter sp. BRH_c19]|nr:MAG: peptide-binding protein [Desulfitibacter sp. BRH_c19]
MSEDNFTPEEIQEKVLAYLNTVDKSKNRDVAKAIGVPKKLVDKQINELAKQDVLEFLYLGTSFVKIKGK